MKVLIIIPCYNEEQNIVATVKSLENVKQCDYVIINDGSTDRSLYVIKENNLNYITLDNNLGIGGAMQVGYKYAYSKGYDIAIQYDGDGQHDANYIDKLIDTIKKENADMVIGSRFIGNKSKFKSSQVRRLGIKLLSFLLKKMTKYEIKDITSGFRAVNKKVIAIFANKYPQEYPEPVTNFYLANNNYNIKEIPVSMKKRQFGKSSIRNLNSIYYMFNVVLLFLVEKIFKGDDNNA